MLYEAHILSSPDQIQWLSNPDIALFSVALPDIWLTTSFITLVLFAGLQNVLLGKQVATVYKPFSLEAKAASDLAIKILKGEDVGTIDKKLDDGTPYIAVTPVLVGPDKVQSVVDAGDAKAADICTDAVAAACEQYGVK